MKESSSSIKLNAHVGLVDEQEAKQIEELAEVVSFDFIGSNEVIEQVCGLKKLTTLNEIGGKS